MDALRLLAAFFVLVSHGWSLSGHEEHDFVWRLTGGAFSASWVGLGVFFGLSGYLIDRSAATSSDWRAFVRRRFLRFWPGLAVVIALSVFAIGPVFTNLSPWEYFTSPNTWIYLAGLSIWAIRWCLPGVFDQHPSTAMNGSLWTLPHEVTLYLVTWAIRTRRSFPQGRFLLLGGLILGLSLRNLVHPWLESIPFRPLLMSMPHFYDFALFYLTGSCVARFPAMPRTTWTILGSALLLWLVFHGDPGLRRVLEFVVIPLAAIQVGSLRIPPFDQLHRFGDFSYGVYIWGFPVQQALIHFVGLDRIGPVGLAFWAFLICLPLAALSWHFVEKPSLARKDRPLRIGPFPL